VPPGHGSPSLGRPYGSPHDRTELQRVDRSPAGPVRFEEEYRLAGGDGTTGQGTTELTQSIKAWPRGPFGLLRPVVARQLQGLLPADLGRLKQLAEDSR
jgi:hypothetical protein